MADTDFRSVAYGLALHERMLSGEPTAVDDIFNGFLLPLTRSVQRKHSGYFDPVRYEESAQEAVFSYWKRPEAYKPTKGLSLYAYLLMAAKRDFINFVDKDKRQFGDSTDQHVAEGDDAPEQEFVDPNAGSNDDRLILSESTVWDDIDAELPDARDQQCAYLMLDEVRETSAYAAIYGISDLSPKEQEHVIKKHKDRIKKRLQRKLGREEYRNND